MDLSRNGKDNNDHSAQPLAYAAPPIASQQHSSLSKSASNSSLPQNEASIASDDGQSLTSFPSLSPSLENSPETAKNSDTVPTTPRAKDPSFLSAVVPSGYDTLFTPTPSANERSALFEDTPKHTREIPGSLHLQPDENVEHLLSRTGAVALVKQMAQDLAQRDAHVTLLQRRAEEREALLRRMLRECEISNLDIENRLRELERSRYDQSIGFSIVGMEPNAQMNDRVSLALRDTLEGADRSSGSPRPQGSIGIDRMVRAPKVKSSSSTLGRSSNASRGWKDYFIPGGGTKRQMGATDATLRTGQISPSTGSAVRPALRAERFESAVYDSSSPTLSRTSSIAPSLSEDNDHTLVRQASIAGSDCATSSKSVAAWALRLVAGNSHADRGNGTDHTNTAGSSGSTNGVSGRAASDVNVRNAAVKRLNVPRARSPRSSISSAHENSRGLQPEKSRGGTKDILILGSPSEAAGGAETNLGPVEMDTILPEGTRPPTLSQNHTNPSGEEYLTDSFGFIYDQRRRRRQNEAEATLSREKLDANVDGLLHHRQTIKHAEVDDGDGGSIDNRSLSKVTSRPETSSSGTDKDPSEAPRRWQDYLKLSTYSTELLSHTPFAGPITDITVAETENRVPEERLQSTIHTSKRGSMPALGQVPAPSASRVVSDNAELVTPVASNPASPGVDTELEIDPVKALVEHLTEVHEAAQREKSIKWNDFLRKVRVDRRRDINSKNSNENRTRSNTMPETLIGDGELIGIAGLGVKGKVGRAKGNEFRSLILSGIPTAYRAKIWAEGSGAVDLRIPGYYEELIKSEFTDMTIVQQIQMDITRTLTDNVYYRQGAGVDKLKEVLLAYARRNPEIGYCQGMNLITANLLLIMPTAEDAFWVLTSMIENILPDKYYDSSLLTSRADQVVLRQYVSEILPQLSTHLENLGIELEALTFQWFLSVFTDCLSAEALFRVWDVVLCVSEGGSFLFQVALALLKLNEKSLLSCEGPADVYGYINQGMTDHAISIDNLIRASEGLKKEVRTEEILKRRQEAVAQELETARQRDAIRKGKAKARVADSQPVPAPSDSLLPAKLREPGRIGAAEDIARTRPEKLTRQASRAEFDEEARQAFGELEVKTPMPIDEEVLWRG